MKKVVLFLVITYVCGVLQAQVQPIASKVHSFDRSGLVFSQQIEQMNDTNYILSCNGSNYEFYNVNAQLAIGLPSAFIVKDFKVFDNKIYFCGKVYGRGFIAKATLTDFFANKSFSFDTIQDSYELNKLQVYKYQDSVVNIVSVGTDITGMAMLVRHIQSNIPAYCIYKSQTAEKFDDIVLTDNFVVTVGRVSSIYSEMFIVRKYSKNNMSNYDQRIFTNSSGWRYVKGLIACAIGGDDIAVVGEGTDENDADWITITSFVNTNVFDSKTQSYGSPKYIASYGEYAHVRDLMYDSKDNKLLILEEYPHYFAPNPPNVLDSVASAVVMLNISQPIGDIYAANIIYSFVGGRSHTFNSIVKEEPFVFLTAGMNPTTSRLELWGGNRMLNGEHCNTQEYIDRVFVTLDVSPLHFTGIQQFSLTAMRWKNRSGTNINFNVNLRCN